MEYVVPVLLCLCPPEREPGEEEGEGEGEEDQVGSPLTRRHTRQRSPVSLKILNISINSFLVKKTLQFFVRIGG